MAAMSRRWRLRLHVLPILVLFNVLCSLHAQPRYVFRFDSRPPGVMFSAGFTARGHNRNLLEHIMRWGEPSAFIATTESYEAALRIARQRLGERLDIRGYIYTIAASSTFYPVRASLEGFLATGAQTMDQEDYLSIALYAGKALQRFRWEQEYVATEPIWATWIHSATPVHNVREAAGRVRLNELDPIPNSRWHPPADQQASALPYPLIPLERNRPAPLCVATIHELESFESLVELTADLAGLPGEDCEDDLWAALDGDEYIHPAMLASCDVSQMEIRSVGEMVCGDGLRLVNASKRTRAQTAVLFLGAKEGGVWVHDEL